MRRVLCIGLLLLSTIFAESNYNANWPNWRGPNNDGVAIYGAPPVEWSESKNVKWKTPIPGLGQSTPIIWGDQIFITTAIELDKKATDEAIKKLKDKTPTLGKITFQSKTTENYQRFVVYSIDKNTGKIIWEKTVREQYPHEGIHKTGSRAANSCVTDGKYVIASFGSFGIYCFDLAGNMIWEKDLGDMQIDMAFGEGASPVLYENKLIIMWDNKEQSKIYVLDKATGEIIWQKDREEASTWSTPLIVKVNGKPQIVTPGKINSIGYDLDDGDEIWSLPGLKQDIIPSPVYDGERVFLMTGFMGKNKVVQALNLATAKGKLNPGTDLAWTKLGGTPYVPSPLLLNGKLYFNESSKAKLSCVDAKTGQVYYDEIKPEGMKNLYASPVAANGMIYLPDRKGNILVYKAGEKYEQIALNKLDDTIDASPAIVGNQLFLRSWKALYCIEE